MWNTIKEFILNILKKIKPVAEEYAMEAIRNIMPQLEAVVIAEVAVLISHAEEFLKGETFTEAKITLVDKAFEKIDLPIVLKPFKGIIKKVVRSKIDSTLERLLQDLKHKLAEKAN